MLSGASTLTWICVALVCLHGAGTVSQGPFTAGALSKTNSPESGRKWSVLKVVRSLRVVSSYDQLVLVCPAATDTAA